MNAKLYLSERINFLKQGKTTLTCKKVKNLLKQLGFIVRDGRLGGHKIYTHKYLESFTSSSFNCGHGRNPEIKPAYIKNIIRVIEQYENELLEYLEARND